MWFQFKQKRNSTNYTVFQTTHKLSIRTTKQQRGTELWLRIIFDLRLLLWLNDMCAIFSNCVLNWMWAKINFTDIRFTLHAKFFVHLHNQHHHQMCISIFKFEISFSHKICFYTFSNIKGIEKSLESQSSSKINAEIFFFKKGHKSNNANHTHNHIFINFIFVEKHTEKRSMIRYHRITQSVNLHKLIGQTKTQTNKTQL